MAGEIQDGETAVGATGEGYDSRALFKDRIAALIARDDSALVVDAQRQEITLTNPGGALKVSEADGIVLMDSSGKSSMQLKGDFAGMFGNVLLGGRTPKSKVADATKVDAELKKLWSLLAGWVVPPSGMDGGAALKATAAAAMASVQSTAGSVSLGS